MGSVEEKHRSTPKSPYTGRWVARLHGKIIAQGDSAEEVRRAARTSRYKESPEIVFMPSELAFSPILEDLHAALVHEQEIYLVGGAVRDALLGRESHDLDFVVPDGGIRIGGQVADALGADFYPLDRERDIGRVIVMNDDGSRTTLDFAAYRGSTLDEDLLARDFTINALAFDLKNEGLYDPLKGAQDLQRGSIRACGPTSLSDDPIRVLRSVRLAAELGFKIDAHTRQEVRQAAKLLGMASAERLRDELFRILDGPQAGTAIRALEMLGTLQYVLPELPLLKSVQQPAPHVSDVWMHTLSVLNQLESILIAIAPEYDQGKSGDLFTGLLTTRLGRYRDRFAAHFAKSLNADRSPRALLFFAALYHDVAKPECKQVEEDGHIHFWEHDKRGAELAVTRARALNFSSHEIERLRVIVRQHMRILFHVNRFEEAGKTPSRKAIYRFFRDTGESGVDLVLLALADIRATYGHTLTQESWIAALDVCRILLENYWENPEQIISPPQLLDGYDLMTVFHLEPGPRVGELLEIIREAQATGRVNSRDQALEFGRTWLEENV